ncbi:MAG: hypothetical protein K2W96_10450 [Gemmataceae bacterium]|nr:hypothetical protein [Gemmataceae bacterium]
MPATPFTLLDRARDRADADAWRRLADIYAPLMRGYLRARGLQPADEDDLSQLVLAVMAEKLPEFRHNGRPGAFRAWLRAILAHTLRAFARSRQAVGLDGWAERLEDDASEMSRRWEAEHDSHVLGRLLAAAEPEFAAKAWQAFRRTALEERPAKDVAAELDMTVNAVLLARSRILAHLRQQARGWVDL